jgi:uncharacterized protein with gpF-like domain
MTDLRMPDRRAKQLPVVAPDHQTTARYRLNLQRAVAAMTAAYRLAVIRAYEKALDSNEAAGRIQTDMAQDAAAGDASDLFEEMRRLRAHWEDYFQGFANATAKNVFGAMYDDNVRAWQARLRNAGFDLKLNLTPSQKLIMRAKVQENVALIRSIPQQYHTAIEGSVLRGFIAGRDLAAIQKELLKHGHSTSDRAALIARDQANKATAQFNAARQRELGLQWARWIHSSAGKEPRPDHVRAGKERWYFDTQKGIDFGDKFGYVLPGEAINCRCGSHTVIPALSVDKGFDPSKLKAVPSFPGAYVLED